ncbi:Wzz/FepE/Etk N-terminal domain-containing protein [uncultured Polaribacter sp.]|uniref:Wzz/FepE/Etk N-terminal domain-containing protein n=1 Tax=uncultured Polaribacter sp. TaxID=174711 RepID=UPI0026377012|nr:Wzz/FepE/Etk N-terminal domain-containing protein [uncultured Polaribacter sp.]
MNSENTIDQSLNEDSIDVIALLKEFWFARKTIVMITLCFFLIGLFVAIFSVNQYTASTTIVPVGQGKSAGGNLGGLASLAGINLGGNDVRTEISPELYPQIVNSIPFQLELLNTKLKLKELDTLIAYRDYYLEIHNPGVLASIRKYTIGLPGLVISALKSDTEKVAIQTDDKNQIIEISKKDYDLIKILESQINLLVNAKEGFISIDVTMSDPVASAQMTLRAQELLQEYAIAFKTQKSIEQLEFTKSRFLEKEKEFNAKKIKLALFQDQNNAINTALARTKLLELQSDYNLSFTIYSELAKQLESERLQVKKDTPIFTILKPVTIPKIKSAPKRLLIIIAFVFLGFILSLGYVKGKEWYKDFKKKWHSA